MKYIPIDGQQTLLLTASECIEAGISENTIKQATQRNSNSWLIIKDPTDLRVTLIGYEKLSTANKQMIIQRWGNPYNHIVRQPILSLLKQDLDAERFFLQYPGSGDPILPIQRVRQYSRSASWLNLLKEIQENNNKTIKSLNLKVPEFYSHLEALINIEIENGKIARNEQPNQLPAKFPTSYRNLRPRIKEYTDKGYACLINKMYGNQLAAKIIDETAEAYLLSLIENPLQYDDKLVAMLYNTWADKNNYKTISDETVGVWRRKKAPEVTIGRLGNSAFNERFIREVKGLLPSCVLSLVEHDDNNLDLVYQGPDGYQYNRYVSIVVIDSRTKLTLGKSVIHADSPEMWMVHHAYLDAMYYIRSLTGGWYLPFEIKADK